VVSHLSVEQQAALRSAGTEATDLTRVYRDFEDVVLAELCEMTGPPWLIVRPAVDTPRRACVHHDWAGESESSLREVVSERDAVTHVRLAPG
jgi:hypothetical protein